MRTLLPAIALHLTLLAACSPPGQQQAVGLVTESDSMTCGTTSTLYTNHTTNPKDLHVRASYNCIAEDSIHPPVGRLVVLDAQNKVVQNQDVQIPALTTHRGTFTVPGGARLVFECGGVRISVGCQWSYSYSP